MSFADEVQRAWRRTSKDFVLYIPEVDPDTLTSQWSACLTAIRSSFSAHVGQTELEQRFSIPEDYATFMCLVGGGWHSSRSLGLWLFSADQVAGATIEDFRLFVTGVDENEPPDEPPEDDGLWLRVGRFSDKHDYLICCDRSHSHYGVVLDGHDSHPWLNGVRFAGCTVLAPSFLAFLKAGCTYVKSNWN